MTADDRAVEQVEDLLGGEHLAEALESDNFRSFLDHVPIAIAVSECDGDECIVYANPAFHDCVGIGAEELDGKSWSEVDAALTPCAEDGAAASAFIREPADEPIECTVGEGEERRRVGLYASVIENDASDAIFRVVAIVDLPRAEDDRESLMQQIAERDVLLKEIQHRVKNNLQMIAALIRIEAKNASPGAGKEPFSRLAGRIDSLHILYQAMEAGKDTEMVDLGLYLGDIASAVMRSHAVEGVRLDMKLDTFPVSINVAMPAGLVVNELFTNALKYAFPGEEGGTILLHSLTEDGHCTVTVSDDGVGLPEGVEWPAKGKLGSLIVRSLRENAHADVDVQSAPGSGMKVTMRFARKDAVAPAAA
ncbi:MAG: ATP-binding protein [Rhizobiaceae bacterium]|nr:ATP-binding protein [Rhizobiaceae bacterium]